MRKILIIDNEQDKLKLSIGLLKKNNVEVSTVYSGVAGIEWLRKNKAALVICNFCIEDMSGPNVLKNIKEMSGSPEVIIVSRQSELAEAMQVMKLGAYDYLTKPLSSAAALGSIQKALDEVIEATRENDIEAEPKNIAAFMDGACQYVIGKSQNFGSVMTQLELVAPTDYSVILQGETGSGKELIAQQIHKKSKRAGKPFMAIDCGALSKELAGSELFGHEKGAFTGAVGQKMGCMELAAGGTVFLDEIGNLSYAIQVSLLRVIQERKIRRLGGIKDIAIDVRIIVASNENLLEATQSGKFRTDLYHRLNEFSIELPPLRERQEDIILYASHFLQSTNRELGKNVLGFSKEVKDIFTNYPWYGNLRELKNVVKRATLLSNGNSIEVSSLPSEISNYRKAQFDIPSTYNTSTTTQKSAVLG